MYANNFLDIYHKTEQKDCVIILVPLRDRYWAATKIRPISRIATTKPVHTLAAVNSGCHHHRNRRHYNYMVKWEKYWYENAELSHLDAPTSSALSVALV